MTVVGFLDEAPGVRSSSRLVAVLCGGALAVIALAIAFALIWVSIRPEDRNGMAAIFAALTAPIGALGAGAWGALKERSKPGEPPDVTVVAPTVVMPEGGPHA